MHSDRKAPPPALAAQEQANDDKVSLPNTAYPNVTQNAWKKKALRHDL